LLGAFSHSEVQLHGGSTRYGLAEHIFPRTAASAEVATVLRKGVRWQARCSHGRAVRESACVCSRRRRRDASPSERQKRGLLCRLMCIRECVNVISSSYLCPPSSCFPPLALPSSLPSPQRWAVARSRSSARTGQLPFAWRSLPSQVSPELPPHLL